MCPSVIMRINDRKFGGSELSKMKEKDILFGNGGVFKFVLTRGLVTLALVKLVMVMAVWSR
jgi:hypothetical protein